MRTSVDKEFDAILASMKTPIETNPDFTISLIRNFMIARPKSAYDIDYISSIAGHQDPNGSGASWTKIISNLGLPDMNDVAYGENRQPQRIYQLNALETKVLKKLQTQVTWPVFKPRRKIYV